MDFIEVTEDQLRQFIDAEAAFRALEDSQRQAAEVRGSMFWRMVKGQAYLIRASTGAKQRSLGARSADTEAMYQRCTSDLPSARPLRRRVSKILPKRCNDIDA